MNAECFPDSVHAWFRKPASCEMIIAVILLPCQGAATGSCIPCRGGQHVLACDTKYDWSHFTALKWDWEGRGRGEGQGGLYEIVFWWLAQGPKYYFCEVCHLQKKMPHAVKPQRNLSDLSAHQAGTHPHPGPLHRPTRDASSNLPSQRANKFMFSSFRRSGN